jgi:hypothetical protein
MRKFPNVPRGSHGVSHSATQTPRGAITLTAHGWAAGESPEEATVTVQLDRPCRHRKCQGPTGSCPECAGKGFVLTEQGRGLAAFVKRHVIGDGT